MEIIDAHVHVGRRHLPADQVGKVLEKAGADRAVIFADPESGDIPGDNQYVLEVAAASRHIPFLYVGGNAYSDSRPFPRLPEPSELVPYRGIKWHCWFSPGHDFGGAYLGMSDAQIDAALTSPGMAALMAKAQEMGVPVNFEEHFDITVRFVELYPDLSIIIPHMGGLNGGSRRVLEAVGSLPNVHFDISLAGLDVSLIQEYGHDRFVCGSDYPYGSPAWSVDRVRCLDIPDDQKSAIFSGNILRLTGLE